MATIIPQNDHGPYQPVNQGAGGIPSVIPDVPVSAVLLVLFFIAGAAHQAIFIVNKKRGHFFGLSGMIFGLCNVRIFTFSLRMAWAVHPTSVRLGIASMVFVYAGTILPFLINLVFTQRIIRAQHPKFGWSKFFTILGPMIAASIILSLLMIIVAVLYSFYTLDANALRITRDIMLYSSTYFAFIAFLPVALVLISTQMGQLHSVKMKRRSDPIDKFGQGRMVHKVWVVVIAGLLNTFAAGYRAGIDWQEPQPYIVPNSDPPVVASTPWYYSKPAFYAINFGVELSVVYLWLLIVRVDKQFHVPNKSRGSYHPRLIDNKDEARKLTYGPNDTTPSLVATTTREGRRMSGDTQFDARDQEVVRTTIYGEDLLKSFSQIDIQMNAFGPKLDTAMDAMSARTLSDSRSTRTYNPDNDGRSMRSVHHDSMTLHTLTEAPAMPEIDAAYLPDVGGRPRGRSLRDMYGAGETGNIGVANGDAIMPASRSGVKASGSGSSRGSARVAHD